MVRRARDYARGHQIGARATVSTWLFPGVTYSMLHNALCDKVKAVLGERYATDVLTKEEELKLEEWIIGSARGKDPASDEEISAKVVLMLKARKADNRRRKGGPGTVKLTLAELRLATERGAEVSHTWLSNFGARHPCVRPMKERNADITRTKKQNEGTVDKHFHGQYGVCASLEFHGKMDMEKKMIKDPRSCWWLDEMPQVLDAANQGKRYHAWGVVGETLERSSQMNRETNSIGICFNAAGFLAGPQLNTARESWPCALAGLKAPDHAKSFNNKIYTFDMKSTYCQLSKTANGVQTRESFLEWLKSLRVQFDAYSAAEVAEGRPPLQEPQWVGTDNHTSRFGADVLEACAPFAQTYLNIVLFMEEAKTSQFIQPPDQVTALCHRAYEKGKKQYKKLYKKVYDEEATIGLIEFIEIWGGCADLGYEGAWFSWCDAQTILGAWRNCGWLGCMIAPEEIDRSSFIDQAAPATQRLLLLEQQPRALTYEDALAPPEGVRAGSLAAAQAQVEQLKLYIRQTVHAPLDPVALGLLEPKVAKKSAPIRDKTQIDESEGGDAFLRDLAGSARSKQMRREEEARCVEQRKVARLEKKEEADAVAKEQRAAFDRCHPVCVCASVPCPMAALKLCATCGDIKKRLCIKVACVAARQPPRLTMREEAPPAPTLQAPTERVALTHALNVPGTGGEVQVHLPVAQEPTAAQARPRRSATKAADGP